MLDIQYSYTGHVRGPEVVIRVTRHDHCSSLNITDPVQCRELWPGLDLTCEDDVRFAKQNSRSIALHDRRV